MMEMWKDKVLTVGKVNISRQTKLKQYELAVTVTMI